MARIVAVEKIRDLTRFLNELASNGYSIEYGPHIVLEDHSELTTIKVYKNNELAAYIVAHYITPYYRAVLSNSYGSDKEFLEKLLEIKNSGENWSIPVNPIYILVLDETIVGVVEKYEDNYPVEDGENLVKAYRERNPGYSRIPHIVIARLIE